MNRNRQMLRLALVVLLFVICCSAGCCLTISGHVRNLAGTGVGGIQITGTGGLSTSTASDGSYSFTVASSWSGTVSPNTSSYLTFPTSYTYTSIISNQTNQDFAATTPQFQELTCTLYNAAHTTSAFGMNRGAIAWGDYDNTGVLDVAIAGSAASTVGSSGTPGAKVFRRDSAGSGSVTFTEIQALTGVQDASLAWGDYDNDGKLDLVVTGDTGSAYVTKLYHGTGSSFSEIITSLTGVTHGCCAWGDYNNDGKQDILIAGTIPAGRVAKLFRNAGGGVFSEVATASLPGLSDASAAWADYDNDGLTDFAMSGSTGMGYTTKIYHNNGNGTFTDIAAGLTGIAPGCLAWGDYDNDGLLDLAFCGVTVGGVKITRICHNNGSSFTEQDLGIPGCQGQIAWGDYDNDGRLDLAIAGDQGTAIGGSCVKVYHNNGSGSFTGYLVDNVAMTNAAIAWGDCNGDGKLDLMAAGYGSFGSSSYPVTYAYQNNRPTANTAPTTPTGLTSTFTSSTLTLSWNAATDSQTPQAGLTYNIRVGTSPGAGDVVSGMADYSTGARRLPAMGNMQRNLSWTIQNITPRTYYWSVQAVDGAFAGSAWATEKSVTVTAHPVYALSNRCIYDYIMNTAFTNFTFTTWGKVTKIDANSFYLDDGTGHQVKVLFNAHGLITGNCAWARGTVDPSLNPRVLIAQAIKKVN